MILFLLNLFEQKDDKRATTIMDSLDRYSESLTTAVKDIEQKIQFDAENIGKLTLYA